METTEDRPLPESNDDLANPERRRLLKTLAAGGGALAAASMVPERWSRGVIDVGTTSAHAQVSPTPTLPLGTGDFQVTLTWDTGDPEAPDCVGGGRGGGAVDIDLHIVEPDGTVVYFAHKHGTTAELDWDNQRAFGPENIFVRPGGTASGTYHIYIVYYCGTIAPTVATIRVRVFANTPQERAVYFTRTLTAEDRDTGINVADVSFPAGVVTEVTGTRPAVRPVDDLECAAAKSVH